MDSMFEGCANLCELDISSFDTRGCSDLSRMFAQCAKLDDILLGEGFSAEGDGSTDCGRLAVKEYGKYKKAKPIAVEGFKVLYHSNFDGEAEEAVEERRTLPNAVYQVENLMFEKPDESWSFMSWNSRPDGSGADIPAGTEIDSVDRDIDIYAI
jgi:surface protein